MKEVHRGVCLKPRDVVALIAVTKTVRAMDVKTGQSFLLAVWMDWRRGDGDTAQVREGLATFFDLYFTFHGDFERIESLLLGVVPPEHRAELLSDAQDLANQNLEQARLNGPPCSVEVQAVNVPCQQEAN